jgi:hypothetical protein
VANSSAGGHSLHVASPQHVARAETVAMLQLAIENVGDDFHVAVAVRAEARVGRDAIVVDDPQRAKAHLLRVVMISEGERVPAVQPVDLRAASLRGRSKSHHRSCSSHFSERHRSLQGV